MRIIICLLALFVKIFLVFIQYTIIVLMFILTPTSLLGTAPSMSTTLSVFLDGFKFNVEEYDPGIPI